MQHLYSEAGAHEGRPYIIVAVCDPHLHPPMNWRAGDPHLHLHPPMNWRACDPHLHAHPTCSVRTPLPFTLPLPFPLKSTALPRAHPPHLCPPPPLNTRARILLTHPNP